MGGKTTGKGGASEALGQPLLLTRKAVARLLSRSAKSITRMDAAGQLPRPVRVGGSVLWRRRDIERWIEQGCPERQTFEAMRVDCNTIAM